MSNLSETTRQFVRVRAGHRCEYCLSHQDYVFGRLQIDHIQPVAKDGSDNVDNLCLACELCNQYKWTKTEGIDSQTNQIVALYNPRKQVWHEHFAWSSDGAHIVGVSPIGRVTVDTLNLNNQIAVTVRRSWVDANRHPPDD